MLNVYIARKAKLLKEKNIKNQIFLGIFKTNKPKPNEMIINTNKLID